MIYVIVHDHISTEISSFKKLFMKTKFLIKNLNCPDCKNKVHAAISKLNGITEVEIDFTTNTITLEYNSHNSVEGLRSKLADIGYPINSELDTTKTSNSN